MLSCASLKLKRVIKRLERQRTELNEILAVLRQIDRVGVVRANSLLSLEEFDKHIVAEALQQAQGNQSEAARILKIPRDQLRYKAMRYGLIRP